MIPRVSAKYCYSLTALAAVLATILLLMFSGPRLQLSTTTKEKFQMLEGKYDITRVHVPTSTTVINKTDQCMKKVRTDFLTPDEFKVWKTVSSRGCDYAHCQFMNGTDKSSVPLVSYPGSGNTWTRGLLERATGVCTGSVYHDTNISGSGLVGEGITSGSVVAVKIHGFSFQQLKQKVKTEFVLYIIRDPYDALVAEFTRRNSRGHTGTADRSLFGNSGKWNSYVKSASGGWYYLSKGAISKGLAGDFKLHIIRFEDLKTDKVKVLKGVMQFLDFNFDEETLAERLNEEFSTFKRSHKTDFDHFTAYQKTIVNQNIKQLIQFVKTNNFVQHMDFLSDYIRT